MHLILKFFQFIFLAIYCLSASANTSDYIFKHLTLEDGLPSLEILQTFQQSNGFIWFSTSRGAIRYDGYSFRHFYFSPSSTDHISNNFVNKIAEDKSGNLWLATEDGLNRINIDGSIDIFKKDDGLPSSWILTLFIDSKNRLWISTGEGLVLYKPDNQIFQKITAATDNKVTAITEMANGDILFATENGLKKTASDEESIKAIVTTHPELELLGNYYIVNLKLLSNDWVAIATEYNGLFLVNFQSDEFHHYTQASGLMENAVSSIEQVSKDQLWVGHYTKGVSVLNLASGNISSVQNRQFDAYSIVSNTIRNIYQDESGIVWVGTDSGVSKLSPQQRGVHIYRALPQGKGLSGSFVYTATPYKENNTLVSSDGGIDLINNISREITPNFLNVLNSDSVEVDDIWSFASSKSEIWMAASSGVGLFDVKQQALHFFSNAKDNKFELPNQSIYTVLAEPKGGVWFTGYNNVGLSLFHPEQGVIKRFMHTNESDYTKEGNFTNETILSSRGEIWMATTDGVFRVNRESGAYQHYKLGGTAAKREYIRVSSIREGKEGVFWIATQGLGLVKIQTKTDSVEVDITYFTTEQGMPSNEITALAVSSQTIWLTSNRDLIKFSIASQDVQIFKNLFNINNLKFMFASAYLSGSKLLISSSKGLVEVDTNEIALSQYSPQVEITKVLSNKESVYQSINKKSMADNYIQKLADGNIEFHFAALDYVNPENNSFSYRLLGFDDSWSNVSTTPQAFYSNLLPGYYTFEVKGTNSDNLWSNNVARLDVYIAIPYWYYMLASLLFLIGFIILLFIFSRRKQIRVLEYQLRHDTLTGLPNRFDFQQKVSDLVSLPECDFALVVLDLDNLKDANDIYGHKVGDEYIKQASKRMQESVGEQGYLARLGGDEFVLLLNLNQHDKDYFKVINLITSNLCKPYQFDDVTVSGSASLGVAIYPKDGNNEHELFIHADSAMYAAKKAGRNQAYFFNSLLKSKLAETIKIKTNLKYALRNQEFELYYQPKLNPINRSIEGFEALIRWIHPVEGLIPPDKFIDEAENNGSIAQIGKWVIETACKQAADLHSKGLLKGNVSVNVSPKQLHTSDIVNIVRNALKSSSLPAEKLELEITESSLMDESDKTYTLLTNLKNIGVSIALDDFGSGYSSLSYLTKYPISTLKIDRSIINLASEQKASLLVLRNIYSLAHSMGMKVVTEGVETEEQASLLLQYKDDLVQGFLYSRPVPFADAKRLLIQNATVINCPSEPSGSAENSW